MLLFVFNLLNLAYNLLMIRKNKVLKVFKNAGCVLLKTNFSFPVRFLKMSIALTFALGLKKINLAELNLKNS